MNEEAIYPSMVIRSQAEAIELLEKENKELKKQLENYKKLGFRCEKALEYLDKIETLAMSDGKIIFSINTFRNILQNEKK